MFDLLINLLILAFLIFRWELLARRIGIARMYLFDALMFSFLAATNFAHSGPWKWLGYVFGSLCILFAINAGRKYLKLSSTVEKTNDKGNSDSGPTAGS
jgi:hypothetical protein